jgi:drug/metabolite transporter (DMT)-like permease
MDDHWDPEVGTQQVAQRRERRTLLLVVGLALLVSVLVAIVMTAVDGGPTVNGRLLLVIGLAAGLLVVLGGVTLAFVWWRRRSGSGIFARSPLWELPTMRQRSRFVKALRRGEPIPPELHSLAVRVAQDVINRRGVTWLYLGIGVLQAGNFFVQVGFAQWIALANALCFLAGAGYFAWLRGQMRTALARLQSVI